MQNTFKLPPLWAGIVSATLETEEVRRLCGFLDAQDRAGKTTFPPAALRFRALEMVAPDEVKVVILGQDPYHGAGQAHGLSFSVPDGTGLPPSLRNIFREVQQDVGKATPETGNLERWARQGVLLLNAVLSVEEGRPGSHGRMGWEIITDAIIRHAGRTGAKPAAFMLWGAYAQLKKPLIDPRRHFVLEAPHPSPLSAYRGFIGCRHFSAANRWLEHNGRAGIEW